MNVFLRLYDYFATRRSRLWLLLSVVVAALCALVTRLDYKEDISDFMPFDAEYRKAMQIYQEVAAGNRVVLLFSHADTTQVQQEYVTAGVERFGELLAEQDTAGWITDWQPQIDFTQVLDVFSFVYEHLPLYLDEADYQRLDRVWQADPDFVRHRLEADYEQIGSLAGSFVQPVLQHDPLGLGGRVASLLRQFQPELQFQQYDGYIFTPDERRCIVTVTSPFGSSESSGNAQLVSLFERTTTALQAEEATRDMAVTVIGSPVIAVSNAAQIKHDSILAVTISAILILALLLYAFRSLRSLLQIAIATGFGFLFALGFLGLFRDSVSVIVLGIASIIIGIAVNYPLHYICHMQHQPDTRLTLRELVAPLFIGNVTTVGAFLTLVPLDAVAVCDLGLFSALMLIGTIIFVLVFMPHITMFDAKPTAAKVNLEAEVHAFDRLSQRLIQSRVTLVILLILTAVFGWFSILTEFDSNLNHINYLTDRQRADLAYMSDIQGQSQGNTVFASVSGATAEEALQGLERLTAEAAQSGVASHFLSQKNPVDLLPSQATQERRITLWRDFWQQHGYSFALPFSFVQTASEVGFSVDAFSPFEELLTTGLSPLSYDEFEPLTSTILTGMVRPGLLVAQYMVPSEEVTQIEEALQQSLPKADKASSQPEFHIFDLASLNSRVSDALSDNFNYIGYACSAIVFLFLWFSFRRLELALVAFIPMAIGWVWILGLMQLLGIQFNIVNVILATFIFGQGDDYTIFVTEGLIRDYREGRKVLVSYQRSILLSALIMLIGIGSLILAKHPAMHSLAEVTIIGMAVVVLMAWFIPPMVFQWLIRIDKPLREYLDREAK